PPFELATNTVFIRSLRHGNEPRAYTAGHRPATPDVTLLSSRRFLDAIFTNERLAGPGGADPRRYRADRGRDPGRTPGGRAVPAIADPCVAGAVPLVDHRGPAPDRPRPRGSRRHAARCQHHPGRDPQRYPAWRVPATRFRPLPRLCQHPAPAARDPAAP